MTEDEEDEAAAQWVSIPAAATTVDSPVHGKRRRSAAVVAATPGGPPPDGRSLRVTRRTAQLNVKIKPETKSMLDRIAKAKRSSQTGVIEWLIERCWGEIEAEQGADE